MKHLSLVQKTLYNIWDICEFCKGDMLKQDKEEIMKVIIDNFHINYYNLNCDHYEILLKYSDFESVKYMLRNIPREVKIKCLPKIM